MTDDERAKLTRELEAAWSREASRIVQSAADYRRERGRTAWRVLFNRVPNVTTRERIEAVAAVVGLAAMLAGLAWALFDSFR